MSNITWRSLTDTAEVDAAISASEDKYQLLFKHSTTCPISSMAKHRLESNWNIDDVECHYLDLLAYRPVSNYIADRLAVHHESPQIILIKNEEVLLDASHLDISAEEVAEVIAHSESKA